jgi:hypothetical protein
MGWTMGDWNQLDVSVETVALRECRVQPLAIRCQTGELTTDWLKWDDWVREQHQRLIDIWADADRPYTHEHGVAPRLSLEKGKLTPEEAAKEHQRQKDLGWDVKGNIPDE